NEESFARAVDEVSAAARRMLDTLVTNGVPRNREVEADKARARAAERFGAPLGDGVGRELHDREPPRTFAAAIPLRRTVADRWAPIAGGGRSRRSFRWSGLLQPPGDHERELDRLDRLRHVHLISRDQRPHPVLGARVGGERDGGSPRAGGPFPFADL